MGETFCRSRFFFLSDGLREKNTEKLVEESIFRYYENELELLFGRVKK